VKPPAETASIMLSAGEASGDLHGGTLCRVLAELSPGIRLFGMGGPRMAAAGMDVVVDPTHRAVVGMSEAAGRLPELYRAYRALCRRLRESRPRALVVIDFPDFNLLLARRARRAGVPVIYFIPPQIWAWRAGRLRQLARRVSRVLAVLPFETGLYERAGIAVTFVGHPLLDALPFDLTRDEARRRLGLTPSDEVIGLLPGSRPEEIAGLLPPMLGAAARLYTSAPARRFALGLAPSVARATVEGMIREAGAGPRIQITEGRTYEVMAGADALLVASGTATLEAALLGTPMVVCYRVARLTEAVARLFVRGVQWVSLPNIIAGRTVVAEILQDEVRGPQLAHEAERLLCDPEQAALQRAAFKDIRSVLGEPGVGRRAARAVLEVAGAAASRAP